MTRSTKNLRAIAVATTWWSLPRPERTWSSRSRTSRSSSTASMCPCEPGVASVRAFIPAASSVGFAPHTNSGDSAANRATGPTAPGSTRWASSRTLRPVRSGFCSEPDSANSLSMMALLSTNQEWSSARPVTCWSEPSASNPGNSGAGNR
ncbi:hypothetical protein OERS_40830 [Oerskovia enterophila]|uniref:Uncharacterized protein n=1 Tax=Oerskovia enterophila TaxID=43678 RepID=A0ABX2XY64_9CELL|nr:hypothetical protein OERS_40830 [Oerskovia enterophila]